MARTPHWLFIAVRSIAIAALGGWLAALAGLPAAWLTGAMIAATAASLAGLDTRLPQPLVSAVNILVGVVLGAGISPEIVAEAVTWPVSLVILGMSIVAVQVAVQTYLTAVAGWDRATAFFTGIPGAMSYVLIAAMATAADLRKVAAAQSVRVFLLVAVLPGLVTAVEPTQAVLPRVAVNDLGALALLLVAGTAVGLLFYRLKVPAGLLCGALVASGLLHGFGIVRGTLPMPVLNGVFVVLGAFVGSRFVGTTVAFLRSIAGAALGSFVISVAVAAIFAAGAAAVTGIDLSTVLIAFAPGGLDAMTSLALALHMDVAFVTVHQLARFIAVAVATPFVTRWLRE